MKLGRFAVFAAVLFLLLMTPNGGRAQVNILGTLSNFDVVNQTGGTVNDFKITIFGVRPGHIKHTYTNPNYGPPSIMFMPGGPNGPANTMIKYGPTGTAFTPPGGVEHFGVVLCGNPVRRRQVCFTWTRNGAPVNEGGDPNLPVQRWDPVRKRVIDVIQNFTWRQPRRLWVRRRINRQPGMVQLEELVRNGPLFEQGRIIDAQPVPIEPEAELAFDDEAFDVQAIAPDVESIVMMYDVFENTAAGGPGEYIGTMLNAAWVQFAAPPLVVRDWLSNFDVVNRTGIRVNDFKITLFGITPNQIAGTYTNPNYGPPSIMAMPGNTMVTYGPTGNYFTEVGQTEHFGVRLRGNPIGNPPRICFDWTLNGEPVTVGGDPNMPTQVWDPVLCRMVDIIRNVTWRQPRRLRVQRRVNRREGPIQLTEMLRNGSLFQQSIVIDDQPVIIEPEGELPFVDSFFDISVELPAMQGVLMSYDVFDIEGQYIGTMMNAANAGLIPLRTMKGRIRVDCEPEDLPLQARFRSVDSFFDVFFTLNADNSYEMNNLPAGQYQVEFRGPNTLRRIVTVDLTDNDADDVNLALEGGDANGDNSIDVLDLDELIQGFDLCLGDPGYRPGTDFNCDDCTDVLDLDVLIRHFDMQGD